MTKENTQFVAASSRSLGTIRSTQELQENLLLGEIEYPLAQKRRCVIRLLPSDPTGPWDELAQRRFLTEAMLGLDFSREHANLLSTFHFGVWDDGRLFQAHEWVAGRTLSELYQQLQFRYSAIEAIARAVLRALRYLHGRGVVHGSVVAGNVLIGTDGAIRMGDFSRSRVVKRDIVNPADVLVEGATDLRALGRMLFELAVGLPADKLVDEPPNDLMFAKVPRKLAAAIIRLLDKTAVISAAEILAMLDDPDDAVLNYDEVCDMFDSYLCDVGLDERARTMLSTLSDDDQRMFTDFLDMLENALDNVNTAALLKARRPDDESEMPQTAPEPSPPVPPPERTRKLPISGVLLAIAMAGLIVTIGSLLNLPSRQHEAVQLAPRKAADSAFQSNFAASGPVDAQVEENLSPMLSSQTHDTYFATGAGHRGDQRATHAATHTNPRIVTAASSYQEQWLREIDLVDSVLIQQSITGPTGLLVSVEKAVSKPTGTLFFIDLYNGAETAFHIGSATVQLEGIEHGFPGIWAAQPTESTDCVRKALIEVDAECHILLWLSYETQSYSGLPATLTMFDSNSQSAVKMEGITW